ncbi:hypothetical protein O6H91_09G001000 [Diphasiastrum complanatum]|uniref:Uncharacterized protein n=1 Tax=Diphasiastrum complanatum TaxID=34168 RepID=A0ACC2CKQ4_DIPCM|nr:hypothetical protein O6H91_09G001000 [Diphasiastrum complanatum]
MNRKSVLEILYNDDSYAVVILHGKINFTKKIMKNMERYRRDRELIIVWHLSIFIIINPHLCCTLIMAIQIHFVISSCWKSHQKVERHIDLRLQEHRENFNSLGELLLFGNRSRLWNIGYPCSASIHG